MTLARCAALGDAGAREAILREHRPAVTRLLLALSRRRDDAADLTQDTLLRALAKIDRYDGRVSLKTYLLAYAHREWLRSRRARLFLPLPPDLPDPRSDYDRADLARELRDALARIPAPMRVTFVMCEVEGLDHAEAALALGVPVGTVKSRLHHARLRLRAILEPLPAPEEPRHEPL